ncbi:MAG TPA: hypothetical protein VL633_01320 [Bacteroidota bacterium]|nr:hypothetical protein [Bacteroidota bacterium]
MSILRFGALAFLFSPILMLSQPTFQHGRWYNAGQRFIDGRVRGEMHKERTTTPDYKPLTLIKSDFLVNTGCGQYGSNQAYTNIARDDLGDYMCVWSDDRTGHQRINAQLLNQYNEKIGNKIVISDEENEWNSQPNIVYNKVNHEYIITWAHSGYDIQMQRVSVAGEIIGNNFAVNNQDIANTNNPSAAVDPNGNIYLTWISEGYDFGGNSVYYL